jgi:hypothetical protein
MKKLALTSETPSVVATAEGFTRTDLSYCAKNNHSGHVSASARTV